MLKRCCFVLFVLWWGLSASCAQEVPLDLKQRPLQQIPPGTVIREDGAENWSHLLLYARPRLGAGDLDKAPRIVGTYTKLFHFVILADIKQQQNGDAKSYVLSRIGIGNAMDINGQRVVVTTETQKRLGADLDMIGRQVLSGNQECLTEMRQVARYGTLAVFDAPAIVSVNGEHVDRTVRHMVWVDSRNGTAGMLIWQLEPKSKGMQYVGRVAQLLPSGFEEDRIISVDSGSFRFGLPTKRAFAIAQLPQGHNVPVTNAFRSAAAVSRFDGGSITQLARETNAALQSLAQTR